MADKAAKAAPAGQKAKPDAVFIQWPATGRTQWVGRSSFDDELQTAGWVLVDPQPERPGTPTKKPAAARSSQIKP